MKYQIVIKSLVVLPEGKPIFSEMATEIRIEDEAGGPFIVISQSGFNEKDAVRFDNEEWPHIVDAIERLFKESKKVEKYLELKKEKD